MATARKLPSGNWRVNIYVGRENGKRKYKSFTASTKKQAELAAAEYNLTRQEKPKCELTVNQAIQQYIDTKTHVFSASTVKNYKGYLKNCFDEIKDIKLCDLTEEKVQRWINKFAENHSPKTVKNIYYLLIPTIKECSKEPQIDVKLPAPVKYEATIPEQEEIEELFQYFENRPDIQAALMVCAIMGTRRGETCALEFSDILKNGRLRINKAYALNDAKEWIIKYPKTKDGTRELVLPDFLKDKLLSLKKEEATDDKIFHFNPNQLTDNFCAAREKLGFKFRLHDLRHYYASVMLRLNTPDKYAMKRMGHSTPTMLKRVYQHLMEEKEREVDQSIVEYMARFSKNINMQHEMQHEQSEIK